jgi:hypothetical protein
MLKNLQSFTFCFTLSVFTLSTLAVTYINVGSGDLNPRIHYICSRKRCFSVAACGCFPDRDRALAVPERRSRRCGEKTSLSVPGDETRSSGRAAGRGYILRYPVSLCRSFERLIKTSPEYLDVKCGET